MNGVQKERAGYRINSPPGVVRAAQIVSETQIVGQFLQQINAEARAAHELAGVALIAVFLFPDWQAESS